VVQPDGRRHIFSHFGSGTMLGVPTFLSQFFVLNPIMFFSELEKLINFRIEPVVYAHPMCQVTTFADMMINQMLEDAKGDKRHGSVGLGMNETINRSVVPALDIRMADLWNGMNLRPKLEEICGKYAEFRTGKKIVKDKDAMIEAFVRRCEKFAQIVHPLGIQQCKDPVFEGAQGLLLDQGNKEFYPHLTRSNPGMKNVRVLCAQAGFSDIESYYVSRTYLTRHGAGPLPGHDPKLKYYDDTNVSHPYQGEIRFAPLDYDALAKRCSEDFGNRSGWKLALTHCDQLKPTIKADLYSFGPTRDDVRSDVTIGKTVAVA
jgi:adenylosuccinate synthase